MTTSASEPASPTGTSGAPTDAEASAAATRALEHAAGFETELAATINAIRDRYPETARAMEKVAELQRYLAAQVRAVVDRLARGRT